MGNDRMVDRLRASGRIRSAGVEAAFRAVDRAGFVPDGKADAAYDDAPIRLAYGDRGAIVSTISQPSMVAYMLEELDVRPGHRILEVGTASGYDAALLAELAGPAGRVVTVEIDPDLASKAAGRLVGTANVTVVTGDGRHGHEPGAPYDRIIVTAGAAAVEPAWPDQLVDGGRLIVPITEPDGRGICITFDLVDGNLLRRQSLPCAFVSLRRSGSGEA